MSLLTFDLLNSQTDIVDWLENQLTGENLPDVVAELVGWNVAASQATSLNELLGDQVPGIVEGGLTEEQSRKLLSAPRLLIDLQEQICLHGGAYWQNAGAIGESGFSSGMGTSIPPNLDRLLGFLESQESPVNSSSEPSVKSSKPRNAAVRWVPQLLAMVLLIGFAALLFNRGGEVKTALNSDWGLNDLKKLRSISSGPEYLDSVAVAMSDWIGQPPVDARDGAIRIQQLIDGCQNLIAAEELSRSPLDPETQKWLHTKCTAWIGKFSEELALINQKPDAWPEVSEHMKTKVEKAVATMREQAAKLRESTAAA